MLFRLFSYITVGEYMKIEKAGEGKYFIFFHILYLGNVDFHKDKLVELVKKLLQRLKQRLLLHGFYKVKVYLHSKIGLFLELVQLEDLDYDDSLDFRVLVFLDEKIYFRTKDYYCLPNDASIYYDRGYFYCDVNFLTDILSVVEFGEFIYGKRLYPIMFRWQKC
jgi:hypothetical protein